MLKNLLAIQILGPLLRSVWIWRLLRSGLLILLLAMIAYGWHQHGIPGVEAKDPLMYTNLTTHFFWVWWLMGVVFLAFFFGRIWCAVCPVGWLNALVAEHGLQRELPLWLRNFMPVTLTLLALQLAVYFLTIHRYPDYTAVLLALMVLLAVVVGLFFRKRAFCSLFCPAGAVFGLYARVAPFQLRVKDAAVCAACTGKECVAGDRIWQRFALGRAILFWHGRRGDCPVDLLPAEMRDSADCHLCLNCARNCGSDNILLGRRPWLADLGHGIPSPSETVFFLVLLGMLTANFSKVYVDLREAIFFLPEQAALLLGWQAGGYFLLAVLWVALLFPFLMLLPGYLILRVGDLQSGVVAAGPEEAGRMPTPPLRPGLWEALGVLSLPCIPLVLSAHMVLAVVKINAKAGYLPFVLRDSSGVQSYLAMNVMQTVAAPGVLIPLDLLKWLVVLLLAGGYLLSLAGAGRVARGLQGRFAPKNYKVAAVAGLTLIGALYLATAIRWLFIR